MTPHIKLILVDRLGKCGCTWGHKIGDTFDYAINHQQLCPMVTYLAIPYAEALQQGRTPPISKSGEFRFSCPDSGVINVFRIDID